MANKDMPTGFKPHGKVLRTTEYVADAAIYPGDLVERTSAGKVQAMATGTAGAQLIGAALSYAAADGDKVYVSDHPDQVYEAQSDDGSIDALTDINLNYDVVVTTGSSTYKISRMEVDGDSGATTAATPLTVIGVKNAPDNALGAAVKVLCRLNQNAYNSVGTDGV